MDEDDLTQAKVRGAAVPSGLIAKLADSSSLLGDPTRLRRRLAEDGYLFLRGALDAAAVRAARAEVLARLEAIDEIEPGTDGRFTGRSRRDELERDRGRFWKSVSDGPRVRHVTNGAMLGAVIETVAGEAVRAMDYLFLRVGVQGRATGLHFDYPFFTRTHDQVWTVWIPLGDCPIERGPVVVVENSHRFRDLTDTLTGFDVVRNPERKADLGADAISFARSRGTRLLSANFRAGDVCLFGMYVAHGSLDHHDPTGRARVSCDIRWQPARLPIDERYFGPDPTGTTGAGYGELNGAKPLTVEWHVR
jgi:ectoine hydroxylase-related dioxygenase (phytanoyl-CoA dioxygenase family)